MKILQGRLLDSQVQYDAGRPVVLLYDDGRGVVIQTPGTQLLFTRHGLVLENVQLGKATLPSDCPGYVEIIPSAGQWVVRGYKDRPKNDLATWAGGTHFNDLSDALRYAEHCELENDE